MENVRYNISPCTKAEVDVFIGKLDTATYVPNGSVKSTERSHYDRYSFLYGDQKVAVVYDVTACIVSVTAPQDCANALLDIFGPKNKSVKRSTVPAHGGARKPAQAQAQDGKQPDDGRKAHGAEIGDDVKRAKLFVPPDRLKRRSEYAPVPTLLATSRGMIVTTDEIYPPQTVKRKRVNDGKPTDKKPESQIQKRPLVSYGETDAPSRKQTEHGEDNDRQYGIAISVSGRANAGSTPRRAVISFGSEDEGKTPKTAIKISTRTSVSQDKPQIGGQQQTKQQSAQQPAQSGEQQKRGRGRPKKSENKPQENASPNKSQQQNPPQENSPAGEQQKRGRGRPKKSDVAAREELGAKQDKLPEYKNGYSVKNYPPDALGGAVRRLRDYGKTVILDGVEFGGTPQELKAYTVTDGSGQKVILRYATKRMTLQLQGKRSELFGEVMAQVSHDSDYSSALENYVEKSDGGNPARGRNKVSDVQNKLKKRLPTAYGFLSEQSRIDFSYGIHDFDQKDLHLSDYSVLLVPAFRGLERFVFDLQSAENINVKMIGQAFDKDDSGRYVLKSGYLRRIDSVIYPEVLVSLYTEYFSQRNFFAHSDNTDSNASRSLPERADAQRIFDRLLDVVEYNAKKLKEIGFSVHK